MVAILNSTINPFWSGRKLLIAYHLLRQNPKQSIPLSDLIYPIKYPHTVITHSWEAYRTFICLLNLTDIGITIKKVILDPLFYAHGDFDTRWNLHEVPTDFSPEDVYTIISGPFADHINKEGNGEFILIKKPLPISIQNALRAPGFFHCLIDVEKRKLRKTLTTYCRDYKAGRLNGRKSVFGYAFTNRLLEKFFKTLTFRQGKHLAYTLGSRTTNSGKLQDQLTDVFRKQFKYEYDLWRKGEYQLPFFEHLITMALKEELTLDGFEVAPPKPDSESSETEIMHWWGYDQLELDAHLRFTLVPPKPKNNLMFWNKSISVIEIEPSDQDHMYVFLNEQYNEPLVMSRRTKSGKLWYALAKDGFAPISDFRSTYRYITLDKRFKFFAKTKYSFSRLLELDEDGYVIPISGVTVRLREDLS
ncbi:MAG: hypothetical protein R8P61_28215 [Bacteroidia bacterium]|nr:hypothetical protein [Bacteroidia bacterium]